MNMHNKLSAKGLAIVNNVGNKKIYPNLKEEGKRKAPPRGGLEGHQQESLLQVEPDCRHDATGAAPSTGGGSGADKAAASGAPGAGGLHKGSQRCAQLRAWLARQAAQALKDARRSLLTGIIVCIILTSMVLLLKELGYYLLHRKRIEDLDL